MAQDATHYQLNEAADLGDSGPRKSAAQRADAVGYHGRNAGSRHGGGASRRVGTSRGAGTPRGDKFRGDGTPRGDKSRGGGTPRGRDSASAAHHKTRAGLKLAARKKQQKQQKVGVDSGDSGEEVTDDFVQEKPEQGNAGGDDAAQDGNANHDAANAVQPQQAGSVLNKRVSYDFEIPPPGIEATAAFFQREFRDKKLIKALSVPYFRPFRQADLQDDRVVQALMNRSRWTSPADDEETVVLKNLIVLFQLTNSMEQCLTDERTADERARTWALISNLWYVTAYVVPDMAVLPWVGPNAAQRAVALFARMRNDAQLIWEDKRGRRMPQDPLLFLLLELLDEYQRFTFQRSPWPFVSDMDFEGLLHIRPGQFEEVVRDGSLFSKIWPLFEGHINTRALRSKWPPISQPSWEPALTRSAAFVADEAAWRRLIMAHRVRTSKDMAADWLRRGFPPCSFGATVAQQTLTSAPQTTSTSSSRRLCPRTSTSSSG